MSLSNRLLFIHIDATTNAAPLRRKRRAIPTLALLAAALLMLVLAAWR